MKTDPPPPEMMFSRIRLEEIQLQLTELQGASSQVGEGVQETRVNTQSLLPLLALLDPNPAAMALAQNLERTLASLRDRLISIEQALLPHPELAAQLATVQATLSTATSHLQRLEGLATSLDRRLRTLESQMAVLFEDADSSLS